MAVLCLVCSLTTAMFTIKHDGYNYFTMKILSCYELKPPKKFNDGRMMKQSHDGKM